MAQPKKLKVVRLQPEPKEVGISRIDLGGEGATVVPGEPAQEPAKKKKKKGGGMMIAVAAAAAVLLMSKK